LSLCVHHEHAVALFSARVGDHGDWDGAEREFRGFGQVDHLNTERFALSGGPSTGAAARRDVTNWGLGRLPASSAC
jgi:hypothetical protein